MATFRINKLDAVRRQLNAAIRMTFNGEDPAAIMTVAAAAQGIVRALCERRGDIESYLRVKDLPKPGYEGQFWTAWNRAGNYLKHADRDADEIHELDEDATDLFVVITVKWFADLGNDVSTEMRVFAGWYSMANPDMLKEEAVIAAGIKDQFDTLAAAMATLPRRERLTVGAGLLAQAKSSTIRI